MEATVRPSSFRETEDGFREVELVVSVEGVTVARFDWAEWTLYDEELAIREDAIRLDRLNGGAPFLRNHDSRDDTMLIGKIVEGSSRVETLDDGRSALIARVRFSRALDDAGSRVVQDIQDGIRRNVSVGYRVHGETVTKAKDQREHRLADDWEPLEVSAVPIPADSSAQFRGLQPATSPTENPMSKRRAPAPEAPTQETPAAPALTEEDVQARAEALAAAKLAEATAAAKAQGRAVEEAISTAIRSLGVDAAAFRAELGEDPSLDRVRELTFHRLAARDQAAPTSGGQGRVELERDVADKAGTSIRAYFEARANPGAACPDEARHLRHLDFAGIAKESLRSLGVSGVEYMGKGDAIDAALRMVPQEALGSKAARRSMGLMTSSHLPLILDDVMHKAMLAGLESFPLTFEAWARRVTAQDFRTQYTYRMGDAPDLLPLTEKGEYQTSKVSEARASYQVETFGRIFGMTRAMMINDDLGVLQDVPFAWGEAANRLMRQKVYSMLTDTSYVFSGDGAVLFSEARGNQDAAAANSTPDLDAMISHLVTMATRTTQDGNLTRSFQALGVICPIGKRATAERALGEVREAKAPATDGDATPNMVSGLSIVSDPLLDTSATPNAWFTFANPRLGGPLYAFLSGEEGIYTESRTGFEVDGFQSKCRLDFGFGCDEWRGLQKNLGA
jgi:hypothetical protein